MRVRDLDTLFFPPDACSYLEVTFSVTLQCPNTKSIATEAL